MGSMVVSLSVFLSVYLVLLVGFSQHVPTSASAAASPSSSTTAMVESFLGDRHTNNWAVLICSSRFWFNYRHISNVLGLYRTVKRLGIPDSQIILMIADDMACNPRNVYAGQIFNNENHKINLYGENIEVDYRGYEVNVENVIRVLTGRHDPETPRSKRLLTDDRSNILIFLTGHGGDEFLKFQDVEEISSHDLADTFEQMYQKKRYNEILFMVDTCQANTLYKRFYSPNILAIGSSRFAENSYSHHTDPLLGLAVIDRFTYYTLDFFEQVNTSRATILDLFKSYDPKKLNSVPEWRTDLFKRPLDKVPLTDFFGSVTHSVMTSGTYQLEGGPVEEKIPELQSSNTYLNPPEKSIYNTTLSEGSKNGNKLSSNSFFHFEFLSAAILFVILLVLGSKYAQ